MTSVTRTYHPEWYGPNVPRQLIDFFEEQYRRRQEALQRDCGALGRALAIQGHRYRLHYGNPTTGRAWGDADEGYLSMSTGIAARFITLRNSASTGGPAVLMDNIIKVEMTKGGVVIYRHPTYHTHEDKPPEDTGPTDGRALRRVVLGRHGSTNST